MSLSDWLKKYGYAAYDYCGCKLVPYVHNGHADLYRLTDYIVSSVCADTVYLVQR